MFPKMKGSCPNLKNRRGCVAAELPAPASRVLTEAWHTLTHERRSDGLPRTLRLDRLWGAPVSRPALLHPWEGTPAGLVELSPPALDPSSSVSLAGQGSVLPRNFLVSGSLCSLFLSFLSHFLHLNPFKPPEASSLDLVSLS